MMLLPPNNRMNPTLLISATINDSTRIVVSCLVKVLATHPQSGLYEPLVRIAPAKSAGSSPH